MKQNEVNWLPHLTPNVVEEAIGYNLDAYAIALEGWRRGLKLKWHSKESTEFPNMHTWYVETPGRLFSLSSSDHTHYFFRTRGDKVSNEAVEIGKDKEETKKFLIEANVPIPQGKRFSDKVQDDEIIEYGKELGFPLVIKPTDGSFGKGVQTNIETEEELVDALIYVRSELDLKDIIVEQHIKGDDYRIYVVNNEVVAAINRTPPNIIGDGVHTIEQLVKLKNEERNKNPRLISCPIKIDYEVEVYIDKLGYTKEDIPKAGEKVLLSDKCNISLGGDPIDRLDELSTSMKDIAIKALNSVPGLPHGAVDMIIDSEKGTGFVLELNPTAQIGSLLFPMAGQARDVAAAIIDYYFPETKDVHTTTPLVYFDFEEALKPLAINSAVTTEVTLFDMRSLHIKKYTLFGQVQRLNYHRWIRMQALERSLIGLINKAGKDKIELVIAGQDKTIMEEFIHIIANEEERANVQHIREETWNGPVKIGFEIQGERKDIIEGLNQQKRTVVKLKNKQEKLERKYQSMLNSYSWRVTSPVRLFGAIVKRIKNS